MRSLTCSAWLVPNLFHSEGVWQYTLSEIYYEEELDEALSQITKSATLKAA